MQIELLYYFEKNSTDCLLLSKVYFTGTDCYLEKVFFYSFDGTNNVLV